MANIGYPLDVSGTSPANRISENRTLTKKAVDGRAFVIPKAAPFYAENHKVVFNNRILKEDLDYHLILESEELSHTLERRVVGGILFNTVNVNSLVTFEIQTVGGDYNLPLGNTVENMAQIIRNPVFTTWSQLTGTPVGLPTWSHVHDWGSSVGYEGFIANFELIYLALLANGSGSGSGNTNYDLLNAALQAHLRSAQAHDKSAVGLGNLFNYQLAQDADYNIKPYPNNKYVTPRSVMYAIDRFIGTQITDMAKAISDLRSTVESNTSAYNNLLRQWDDLETTLDTINRNYTIMSEQVRGYNESLGRLELEYRAVAENQQAWLLKLSEFNTTLIKYGKDYALVIEAKDALIADFKLLQKAYEDFKKKVDDLEVVVKQNSKDITTIQQHALYPGNKAITAGSYHFRIKPKEIYSIILIGAGGGMGEFVTDVPRLGYNLNGENGSSTTLWCLQDLANGEYIPSSKPIAITGGGFGGGASYGTVDGVVNSHGLGGRGGQFILNTAVAIQEEASNGEGGLKGYGAFIKGDKSSQDTGYEYYGAMFGKGATAENALGQGGEGAFARFRIENKLTVDLEFMVTVGVAGRSYSLERYNALGGLAILNKIK